MIHHKAAALVRWMRAGLELHPQQGGLESDYSTRVKVIAKVLDFDQLGGYFDDRPNRLRDVGWGLCDYCAAILKANPKPIGVGRRYDS